MKLKKLFLSTLFIAVAPVTALVSHSDCVTILTNTTNYTLGEVTVKVRLVGTATDGEEVIHTGIVRVANVAPGQNAEIDLSVANEPNMLIDEITGQECQSGTRPVLRGLKVTKTPNDIGSWFEVESIEILEVAIVPQESFYKTKKRGPKRLITCYPHAAKQLFEDGVVTRHIMIHDTPTGITFTPIS